MQKFIKISAGIALRLPS